MIKKAKVEDTIVDVLSFDEYTQRPKENIDIGYTAVERNGILYPVKRKTDSGTGIYSHGILCKFIDPPEEEKDLYSSKNIIDFNDVKTMKDMIEKTNTLKNAERTTLTTVNNIFVPKITETDTPEMECLKMAVKEKQIDMDSYKHRLDNNARRLLLDESITFGKLRLLCNAFDIDALLTLKDKNPDVPNPIGKEITVNLTVISFLS